MRRLGAALAVVGWLLLVAATPASADVGESIASYDVTLTVHGDGTLGVSEAIAYDFGPNERHGIFRSIPTRVPFDHDNDRVYDLGDVRVTSPTGAPTDVDRSSSGGTTTLRIGDPDETVSGRQDYVISYTVDAALNAFDDHDELYWNAIGAEWDVPIAEASVVVTTPQPATQQACFAGPSGSALPCGIATASGGQVTFAQPEGLVLASDADGQTVLVRNHLAHQLEERHLLLDGLEERIDAPSEVRFATREVRAAGEDEAILAELLELLGHDADDGADRRLSRGRRGSRLRQVVLDPLHALAHRAADEQGAEFSTHPREVLVVEFGSDRGHPLRDAAGVGDDDHQHPATPELDQLDVRDMRLRERRILDDCDLPGQLGERTDGAHEHVVEVAGSFEEG